MGFTKLDEGIVYSSIWSEPYPTRLLWITMLAMSDSKGFVASSRSGLIRAANITDSEFDLGIMTLEFPDKDSRSPDHDGRRVEKVPGGWVILNYIKYRNFSYSSSPEAIRQRRHRDSKKERDAALHVTKGCDISASASASASASLKGLGGFAAWWEAYPKKVEKKDAENAFAAAIKNGATEEELRRALNGYTYELSRKKTEYDFIKNPATFLRKDRWKDFLEVKRVPEVGSSPKEKIDEERLMSYRASAERSSRQRAAELGLEGDDLEKAVREAMERWDKDHLPKIKRPL